MSTFADRMVKTCEDLLAAGPMGDKLRGDEYREFISAKWPVGRAMISPKDKFGRRTIGGDIGKIKTSCAVCAGSASYQAGLDWDDDTLVLGEDGVFYRMWSGDMFENWYQLGHDHPAWAPFPHPVSRGDVFDLGGSHLGICLEHLGGGRWRTAEGGGGDGTKFSISEKRVFDPKRPTAWDPSMGRALRGVFRAAVIGQMLGEVADTEPAPACPSVEPEAPTVREPRTLKLTMPRMTGDDVKAWQVVAGAKADGVFGPQTESLTVVWQRAHGLVADGVVGPATRAKAGL